MFGNWCVCELCFKLFEFVGYLEVGCVVVVVCDLVV